MDSWVKGLKMSRDIQKKKPIVTTRELNATTGENSLSLDNMKLFQALCYPFIWHMLFLDWKIYSWHTHVHSLFI